MAIAIGLVIDDAVVITENIVRHLHLTNDRTAAIREARAGTHLAGDVVDAHDGRRVPAARPARGRRRASSSPRCRSRSRSSVLVSLVLAVTIIPLLAEQFLTGVRRGARRRAKRAARLLAARGAGARPAVGRVCARPARGAAPPRGVLRGGGRPVGGRRAARTALVGTGFLPDMDEGAFILDYWTPGGTALAETDRQLHVVEQILTRDARDRGARRAARAPRWACSRPSRTAATSRCASRRHHSAIARSSR